MLHRAAGSDVNHSWDGRVSQDLAPLPRPGGRERQARRSALEDKAGVPGPGLRVPSSNAGRAGLPRPRRRAHDTPPPDAAHWRFPPSRKGQRA
ncbi:hypothetical protein EAO73_31685 [Streptomyces sp. col6]|nr:hypothetical protein EAO73_31685 [Streptomyces sp. col6]